MDCWESCVSLTAGFQSSIAPKSDRNFLWMLNKLTMRLFQSSIAPKSDRNDYPRPLTTFGRQVPILDRPEERPQ